MLNVRVLARCGLTLTICAGSALALQQKTIQMILTQPYTDTGLPLSAGQVITVSATGLMNWYTGNCNDLCLSTPVGESCAFTGFAAQGLPCWSLIGKIGQTGTPFAVGAALNFTAGTSGEFFLGINDTFYPDNTGSWTAQVVILQALQFVPIAPCRIIDTRDATGTFGGPFLAAGTTRAVPAQSSACGIPASAQAYALNLTVVPRTSSLGYLTVWPAGQSQPLVSTLNSPDGSVIANSAIVPAGTGGSVNVFASDETHLVIDIDGYFTPPAASSLQFYPLTPCRVLDTRNPNSTFGGPFIAAGSNRAFPILSSSCAVPPSAQAYSFNVTVVPHGALGYLTAWPTGQVQRVVSTLNSPGGTVLANAALIPAGTGGAASFYASNDTDLVLDINGYFAPPGSGGLNFYPVPPCRVADTRNANGSLGGPIISGNTSRAFALPTAACGLPAGASAYSLNLTVVPQGSLGYLTAWPTGQAQPGVSTLNALKGLVIANAAIVSAGSGGAISVFAANATHVVIDANGYFGQ